MSNLWDFRFIGSFQPGTLLHLAAGPKSGHDAMPAVGDTFHFASSDKKVAQGNVVGRSAQTIDVNVAGHGLVTIQPAPSYHPGRGSGTQNEVQISQWVIV